MADSPYTVAARQLLQDVAHRLPDLSSVTVLVPHFHAAQGLLNGLRAVIEQPVFIPPRLLTLPACAAAAPGCTVVEPDSRRLAEIYDFLKQQETLAEGRLWTAAAELAGLLRELSDELLTPPRHYAEFAGRLEAAYRRGLNAPLNFEARLAFELWYAMQQSTTPDAGRDYGERLAWVAARAEGPLYHLGLAGLTALERRFLVRYAERQPVQSLALPPGDTVRAQALAAIWQQAAATAPAESPFAGQVRLLGVASLEDEARAAATQVMAWLAAGRQRIAVIVLDRVSARRLRALLEREQVLVQDETGWNLSTVAVSHVLDRWFALIQDDCYHRDLLDFLKSPFVFVDIALQVRRQSVADLERAQRRAGVVEGLRRFAKLAREQGLADAEALLARIESATSLFRRGRQTLGAWQASLLQALDLLGATQAFEVDPAGSQLLALLRRLESEMAGDATRYRLAEWRRWLMLHLDQATFTDMGMDSPVRFTHLRAARLREFDGVIVLGADARHLPGTPHGGLFNEAVRRELGLPGQATRDAGLLEALADVLCRTPEALITWQARQDGEPNAVSPWLEVLNLQHRRLYGASLVLPDGLAGSPPVLAEMPDASRPAPAPAAGWIPGRVTVSAWQSLVQCPYQFHARHLLRLNELDEVAEAMDKRDYGTLLHAALARFHTENPRLVDLERADLEHRLEAAIDAVFAGLRERHYLAEAWRLRWRRRQGPYLDWALAWERQGYRFEQAEVAAAQDVALPGRGTIRFEGRLDRLDRGPGGRAVLDYKTNAASTLRAKLKHPGEDVQLPAYVWLAGANEAGFVTLDADKVDWLALSGDLGEAAQAEAERFTAVFVAIAAGTAMPAQGAPSTCGHCEMRGLCRRDHWADAVPAPIAD